MDENIDALFEEEIAKLISYQQEGDYWDFKKAWHKNKGDLLHDIICMANNLDDRDAYIIIGVDEENNYSTVDISNDPNRKNTQNIVDFLKDKKFAGEIRPLVYVKTLLINQNAIDIIVIQNSYNTPFYLTERYMDVNPNNIYTRIHDVNTSKNKSADINCIERLWRKRFHLDEEPLEKIRYYLKFPEAWEDSPIEYEMSKYFKKSPAYIVKQEPDESRTGYEFYLFGQTDNRPHWYTVTLYYHQTALEQLIGIALDGARCFVIAPARSGISFSKRHSWDIWYCYFEKDSLRYDLLSFYHENGGSEYEYAFMRFMECVLEFNTENERIKFERYIENNEDLYRNTFNNITDDEMPYFPDLNGYVMEPFKKEYRDALTLQKMLSEFRNQIQKIR